jgi:hypothetical protein
MTDYTNMQPDVTPDDDLDGMMAPDSTPQDRTRQLYCLLAIVFFFGLAVGACIAGAVRGAV